MKKLVTTTLALALAIPTRAIAGYVRDFDAKSIEAGNYPTLTVWAGSGLTLNFTQLNESVKQVWLDDPSKLALDYAGELCVTPCAGGVKVLHVKRITGLRFENLPATPRTTLTVVTVSAKGEKVYKFILTYGSGTPQYLAATITPGVARQPSSPAPSTPVKTNRRSAPDQGRIALLQQGLVAAREQLDDTTKNRLVLTRMELFIEDLQSGYTEEEALRRNHLSPNAVATVVGFASQEAGDG